jgi:hypothetical protein
MVGSAERLKPVEPETGCRNQYAQGYALAWAFDRWHSVPREGCVDAPRPCRFLLSRQTGSDAPAPQPSRRNSAFFLRDTARAMSQEIAKRGFELVSRGDLPALLDVIAPDF